MEKMTRDYEIVNLPPASLEVPQVITDIVTLRQLVVEGARSLVAGAAREVLAIEPEEAVLHFDNVYLGVLRRQFRREAALRLLNTDYSLEEKALRKVSPDHKAHLAYSLSSSSGPVRLRENLWLAMPPRVEELDAVGSRTVLILGALDYIKKIVEKRKAQASS